MNLQTIYNNYNLGLFPLIHITNQNKDPKLKVNCYYNDSIISTDFFEFQQFLKFENERRDKNHLLSLRQKHNNKITEYCEDCLMNLCPDCLLTHNVFHKKKNLVNIMNSITDEKINQFKQKLIEETNNIKLIQNNSNQLIYELKNQIEKLKKLTKDFIDQQNIQIDIVQQYLIFFEKKKNEDVNLNFNIIENFNIFWKIIFDSDFNKNITPSFLNNNIFTCNQTNYKKYEKDYDNLVNYLNSPNNQLLLNNIILKNEYFSKIEKKMFVKNIEDIKFLSNYKICSNIQEEKNHIINISKLNKNKFILILKNGYIKIYDIKKSLIEPIYSKNFNNCRIENIFILQKEIILLKIKSIFNNNNNNNNITILEPIINEKIMYSLIDWNFNLNIECNLIYELENKKLLLLSNKKTFIFNLRNDSNLYEFKYQYQLESEIMQSINIVNSKELVQFNKNYIAYISLNKLSIFDLNNLHNINHSLNINYIDSICKIEQNVLAVCSRNILYLISGISLNIFYKFTPNYDNCFIKNSKLNRYLGLKFLVKISENNFVTNNLIQIYISEKYISLMPIQNIELINDEEIIALNAEILVVLYSTHLIKFYTYFD